MKTIFIILISVVLVLIINSKIFWIGVNPFILKLISILVFILILTAGYLIYHEKSNQNRLIQICILVICLSSSILKVRSDFKKSRNYPNKSFYTNERID